MKTDEIRTRYLQFFEKRDHRVMKSDRLVPASDPTLLFTGAGMNQFKDEFYGRGDKTLKRATTCQKCMRTGDIENVGRTASHHTFFEMLGNFSFGDYFKEEAIGWAWEFMLQEMGVNPDLLSVSVYGGDDEAYRIWHDVVGLAPNKIYKFDEGENFWPPNARTEGPNGPCGPCSEIFFDTGLKGCGRADCDPSCDCKRYVEVWNLVFQQFDRKGDCSLDPLPMCNIDTGMGLERMARVMQGVQSNFEIDIFARVLDEIKNIVGREPRNATEMAQMRRILDHARAVIFCVADGVIPSNEERGYVVRRLLRRAVRDGYQLGVEEPFMVRLVEPHIETYGETYPELADNVSHIETVVGEEEKAFQRTVKRGSQLLSQYVANLKRERATVLRGKEVFDLYQTYGFPIEMTESILTEEDIGVDVQGFLREMEAHQQRSKQGADFERAIFAGGPLSEIQKTHSPTEFTGYRTLESAAHIIGIISGENFAKSAEAGQEATIVLDRSPAYGESGGQVGDRGWILTEQTEEAVFEFSDVQREKGFLLHIGMMTKGSLSVGDAVQCCVDKESRMATARNHTATHLLHHALREVLGSHAKQAGSHVSPERLRFDFANPNELSADQLQRIEDIVNDKILEDEPVVKTQMSLSEAREAGAVALFGETYGDIVRVVSAGDYSRELCGGTHCDRTGQIGLMRVVRESSVAGGVRRIEAVTGTGVLSRLRRREQQVAALCDLMGAQDDDLVERAEEMLAEIRLMQKQVQQAREKAAKQMAGESLADTAEEIAGAMVVLATMDGGPNELRSAADVLRKSEGWACVLASPGDGKVALVAGVAPDLIKRGLSARQLAQTAASILGGGGGGRDDMAQAGGKDASKLGEAFAKVREVIAARLA